MMLRKIEERVSLSSLEKILLTTDGSITRILEAVGGEKIAVETVRQVVIPADEEIAEVLNIPPGAEVNYRVVNLQNSGGVLIRAVSYAPIARLRPEFKAQIMKMDKPIGRIMGELRIEARREITSCDVVIADKEDSQAFKIPLGAVMLKRNYNIIYQGEVLLNITEKFPHALFK